MGSNRFWHIVSVVKERLYASLSCRVANNNLIRVTDTPYLSTRVHLLKSLFHTSPQPSPHLPRTPSLTTPTIDTFSHFTEFFFRNFPAIISLHLTFSQIPASHFHPVEARYIVPQTSPHTLCTLCNTTHPSFRLHRASTEAKRGSGRHTSEVPGRS